MGGPLSGYHGTVAGQFAGPRDLLDRRGVARFPRDIEQSRSCPRPLLLRSLRPRVPMPSNRAQCQELGADRQNAAKRSALSHVHGLRLRDGLHLDGLRRYTRTVFSDTSVIYSRFPPSGRAGPLVVERLVVVLRRTSHPRSVQARPLSSEEKNAPVRPVSWPGVPGCWRSWIMFPSSSWISA